MCNNIQKFKYLASGFSAGAICVASSLMYFNTYFSDEIKKLESLEKKYAAQSQAVKTLAASSKDKAKLANNIDEAPPIFYRQFNRTIPRHLEAGFSKELYDKNIDIDKINSAYLNQTSMKRSKFVKSYIGKKVALKLKLYDIDKVKKNIYRVDFKKISERISMPYVSLNIDSEKFPYIQNSKKGEEYIIYGEISHIDLMSISLINTYVKKWLP